MTGLLTCGLIANAVFLIFHPAWASSYPPVLQSLGINLVIFLVPAIPFLGALISREEARPLALLWAMIISFAVLVGALAFFSLTGWPLTAAGAWNGTWAVTNLLLLVGSRLGMVKAWRIPFADRRWQLFGLLFIGSYSLYLWGAVSVVPAQQDHDLEVQGTGYGLLTRFEPLLLTDRNTLYYFAHPPLLHFYAGASFLYYDQLDQLKYFDAASQRALAAEQGRPFEPPPIGLTSGGESMVVRHKIVGVQDGSYLLSPSLPDGRDRIAVRELELISIYEHYARSPHKLATRTPSIFLASLTVALLGCWAAALSGQWWAGMLAALAYATSPEVFVRSSYGGYFAISNFALLLMLLATAGQGPSTDRIPTRDGFAAGCIAALANHKLVIFPVAAVLWLLLTKARRWHWVPVRSVVTGFALGAALFWVYGWSINPAQFLEDHFRTHLLDRIIHHNPLGYGGYPGVARLWIEFWQHTGYLLLPIGVLSLVLAVVSQRESNSHSSPVAGLLAVYILIAAVVFSWVDWRMTKHLMLIALPLHIAPLLWAGGRPKRLASVCAVFAVLLIWNLYAVHGLSINFAAFRVSPAW
ncbi:MAG: hypothetical protein A3F90_06435 [Deltaproteobacteria bacterium RIFCSPLOWO2_12_FULL_60_19]|nr:MAG: hypothetical protein A3F90_06435 [Deltaproteobacteria bacterium RIFCSPLOWO2_12_FULL_60_19]